MKQFLYVITALSMYRTKVNYEAASLGRNLHLLLLLVAALAPAVGPALPCSECGHPDSDPVFNVGFTILEFQYAEGTHQEAVTVAVWYPTLSQTSDYIYNNGFRSRVAPDAPPAPSGPFPLIAFYHGGYSTGIQSLCLTEYLASRGFIVAAPDFVDTVPPEFVEPAAFERIQGSKGVKDPVTVLRIVGEFAKIMNADREKFVWYMETFRLRKAHFAIDIMLQIGEKKDSPFYGLIDQRTIGASGHSLGGLTTLGLIGAHPKEELRDTRVKAALVLSSGVYPYEDRIDRIQIPLMTMHGDHDEPMNPNFPRSLLYERTSPPKYYLVLGNSTHFTFGNMPCQQYRTVPSCQALDPRVKAIDQYGCAFFEKYLKNRTGADDQLSRTDPILIVYEKNLGAQVPVTQSTTTTRTSTEATRLQPTARLVFTLTVAAVCVIAITTVIVAARHRRSGQMRKHTITHIDKDFKPHTHLR